jgi:hypothetical protein
MSDGDSDGFFESDPDIDEDHAVEDETGSSRPNRDDFDEVEVDEVEELHESGGWNESEGDTLGRSGAVDSDGETPPADEDEERRAGHDRSSGYVDDRSETDGVDGTDRLAGYLDGMDDGTTQDERSMEGTGTDRFAGYLDGMDDGTTQDDRSMEGTDRLAGYLDGMEDGQGQPEGTAEEPETNRMDRSLDGEDTGGQSDGDSEKAGPAAPDRLEGYLEGMEEEGAGSSPQDRFTTSLEPEEGGEVQSGHAPTDLSEIDGEPAEDDEPASVEGLSGSFEETSSPLAHSVVVDRPPTGESGTLDGSAYPDPIPEDPSASIDDAPEDAFDEPEAAPANAKRSRSRVDSAAQTSAETQPLFATRPPPEKTRSPRPRILQPVQRAKSQLSGETSRPASSLATHDHSPIVFRTHPRLNLRDPLTVRACLNLGLEEADISYPTENEIRRYSRDPAMRAVIRNRIIERVDRNVADAHEERERLRAREAGGAGSRALSTVTEEAAEQRLRFEDAEHERMRRLAGRNKRDAERLIHSLFVDVEIQKEAKAREEREIAAQEEHERQVKRKRLIEEKRQRDREEELAEREAARLAQIVKAEEIARERLAASEARRVAAELAAHKKFEETEMERRQKLENNARAAQEAELKRQERAEAARAIQIERERLRTIRLEEQRTERLAQSRLREEAKERHIVTVKLKRQRIIDTIRTTCEQKWEDARIRLEEFKKAQEEMLEERRKAEAERIEEGQKARTERETKQHEGALNAWMTKEEKAAELQRTMQLEEEERRQMKALEDAFRIDDHRARHARATSRTVADAFEKVLDYEKKLRTIALIQQERRRQWEEAEMRRRRLELETQKMLSDSLTTKDLGQRNPKELRELADRMGIDLDELRKKAKESRKSRGGKLPPIADESAREKQKR